MKSKHKPTDSELEILQVLWTHGPSTVRFVNDELNEEREIGYTTSLKLMQIMAEKELVLRNTESRQHIYTANVKQEKVQGALIEKIAKAAFSGSAMKLVMSALGNHKASPEELKAIKNIIKKMENDK